MSDFKITRRMWNKLILAHNKLHDRVRALEVSQVTNEYTEERTDG